MRISRLCNPGQTSLLTNTHWEFGMKVHTPPEIGFVNYYPASISGTSSFHGMYSTSGSHTRKSLGNKMFDLITLHHSLYYCSESKWEDLFMSLCSRILRRSGAIHAVIMASASNNHYSTTWLYNHFVGRFLDCRNDQNLKAFGNELSRNNTFRGSEFQQCTHRVDFFVDDFEKFMAVVWMIIKRG